MTFGTLEFNDIFKASGGNPLYLFYFSKFQISPLPENLVEYQNAIWSSLNYKQQEILSFVSIPFSNVSISEITDVLGYSSSLALSKDIDDLSSLLKTHKGVLEIFHPSFKEFIIEILLSKGLLNDFQEKLGSYFLEKSKIVQATFLLIDVAPAKVDKYLYDVFPRLINWGELNFALKVLNAKLSSVKRSIDKGYIYYHLCHVHHLLGNKEDSTFCINKSLAYFKKAKHGKFYSGALMFKAMNLIECGKVDEAIEIADTVLSEIKQDEAKFKAPLLVNLSKIYVDLSEFEKGAYACKEAFEIFEAEGNREGKISSLVNLVTCLAHLDEHKSEAEIYGLRLLEIVKTTSEFSTEVIVLNALTSIYREKKEYAKAKDFCSRAIKLCQQYGIKDKVILNMINSFVLSNASS